MKYSRDLVRYIRLLNTYFVLKGEEGIPTHRRFSKEHKEYLLDAIEGDLSPENLTCDGELSAQQVDRKFKMLNRIYKEVDAHSVNW